MNPRELIRAAQSKELARDWDGAIALLRQAADHYREAGKGGRAEQLERHAERLGAQGRETAGERHPVLPERSPKGGVEGSADPSHCDPLSDSALHRDARSSDPSTSALRAYAQGERGPVRADPSQEAWCSFCCRPGAEVGELVAGPTGSFICAGCVNEATRLLRPDGSEQGGRSPDAFRAWSELRDTLARSAGELRELLARLPPIDPGPEEPE